MFRTRSAALLAASALAALLVFPAISVADDHEHEDESWRLFIADHTLPVVRAVDVETGKEIGRFDISGYAALTLSDTGKTVFAVQGSENVVNVISTGISLADHGEHRDIEVVEPKLLPITIKGSKPGHVVAHDDEVAIFYDRENRFDLLRESEILEGKAEARAFDTIAAHHGIAVPTGNHILVSVANTEAPVNEGALPPRLGLRVLDSDGKRVGKVATCTGLHGEATSARLVAFGCAEGVLIARPGGVDGPKLEMLAYPETLPKDAKVSTLLGGTSLQFFLGNYGDDKLVLIDPDDAAAPYRLIELPTRRVDFALDPAEPRHAYILTEDGNLHLLDTLDGKIEKTEKVTEPYSKDGHWRDPRPRLAIAGEHIAITDPRHSLIRIIDHENLKEIRTIPVEGQPFAIVAAGGSGATH